MPTTPAGLVVPVSREERMRAINALRERMEEVGDDPQAQRLERELRLLDDRLRVVKISPRAGELHPKERGPGVIPGRWHIKLLTHPQNAYFPICGPNWEYRDPELAIVEEMKERDLWKPGALEKIRKGEEDEERARIRQALLEKEQGEDEVALAYRAAKRVSGDGGEYKRTDRGHAPHRPYAGGVTTPMETSDSGLLIPAGGLT
jgi:hypothetical protein